MTSTLETPRLSQTPPARYDGNAAWYDERLPRFTQRATPLIRECLGRGPGVCLDVGCGVGVHLSVISELGWSVVGLDLSADQLSVAATRRNATTLVRADAQVLPFAGVTFDAVVAAFIHTDVDDWSSVVREAARVLRPNGRLVYVGIHPCFVGPFSRYASGGPPHLFGGYRQMSRKFAGPGIGAGLRRRVGARHVPLALLLQCVIDAGLTLRSIGEPGPEDYPRVLSLAATRAP